MVRILNDRIQIDKRSLAIRNLVAAISDEKPTILSKWIRRIKSLEGRNSELSFQRQTKRTRL